MARLAAPLQLEQGAWDCPAPAERINISTLIVMHGLLIMMMVSR